MTRSLIAFSLGLFLVLGITYFLRSRTAIELPQGETVRLSEIVTKEDDAPQRRGDAVRDLQGVTPDVVTHNTGRSNREIYVTDGTRHSIPLDEILSGGPGKDGIPSIDAPLFVSAEDVTFLEDESIGLGLLYEGEARFYPYSILVWHEIVNDTIAGDPILVTYCPLCATGVVFDRRVDGSAREFGVSGMLWQSNLLMYDRAPQADEESLWSQVLGEAVLGPRTGDRLSVIFSDAVRYGDWVAMYPETRVLSQETGAVRRYGVDPYDGYYTDESVSFGATFTDERLHPKTFVLGIEVDGYYKAYVRDALPVGVTTDVFQGRDITITKTASESVRMEIGDTPLPYIGGFWFSWLAVHPDTELYQ